MTLSTGDYLSVEAVQTGGIAGWSSRVYGGGAITAETKDISPETPGKQAVLLSALGRGGSARLSQEMVTPPGQSALQLNGVYEISFLAKGVGGNNQLNVSLARRVGGDAPYLNRFVALTDNWAQYTLSFSAFEAGTQSSPLQLSFAASGASVELDDVSLQQSNSESTNATAFRDEVVNALQQAHPGTIRMVSGGNDVLTQLASPFARKSQGLSSEVAARPGTAPGIQEFLQLCATVGADPWITVPTATTPAEMANLVQYLAGDGSDSWSALRIARGQVEPWTSEFGKVHIELENTTGISGSASAPMAPSAYANWSNAVFGAARRSTDYSASKLDLMLSGSAPIPPVLSAPSSILTAESSSTQAAAASEQVINCASGFASSGACGVAVTGGGGEPFQMLTSAGSLSGSQVNLIPAGTTHGGSGFIYQTAVNVQAFSTTFTFVPNGYNIAFVIQNNTSASADGGNPKDFASGAGCEAGFFQAFNPPPPNNILALELDSYSPLTNANGNGAPFTYSSVQIYEEGQSPCNPNDGGPNYTFIPKISTYPVPLDSPANSQGTTTGHRYSVTLAYNGTNLVLSMYDVTAGGSCPGSTCFTQTFTNVNIPALVGSNTAYIGFTGGVGETSSYPLYISSLVYTVLSAGSTPATAPTFSPAAGTYSSSQSVTISDSTAGGTIYYTTNGTTPTTSSTKYSGAITVSSTETLQAIAVASGYTNSSVASAAYTINPAPATPTFSLAAGTYSSAQTVTISDATSGATIYYTTNGTTPTTASTKYSGAITVSSTETLEAVATLSDPTASAVASATYVIESTSINYPSGGFTASSLALNGGATIASGGLLQLTDGNGDQARSAWFATKLPVQTFTTDFTFEQLNATADGLTFTIQGQSPAAVGSTGGALGYEGITNSVAVKFDLYNNDGEGIDSTGLYTGGTAPTVPSVDLSSTPINLHSGDVMHAHIVYDGTNLTMTLTDTATGGSVTEVFPVNIPSLVGGDTAYVGFTGGTGGATATQNVMSWTYSVGVSTPSAATPKFSVAAGTYTSAQTVTISDTTSGATIYYTTNGTTPTTASTKYSGAITVSSTETLKAVATASGSTTSAVASATYVIESPSINYPSGSFTASSLALNGGAAIASGGLLQLTDGGGQESRSAWFATELPVQTFTTDFTFEQLNATADGMTFTIQGQGSGALGDTGESLGYGGMTNSVAVKFDLYNNGGEGIDSTGLYTGGATPTVPSVDLSSTPINLHSGDVMHAHMVYDGANLTMTLTDTATAGSVTEVFPVNIPSLVGTTAYVGFTGGTGGSSSTQNVLSWSYSTP